MSEFAPQPPSTEMNPGFTTPEQGLADQWTGIEAQQAENGAEIVNPMAEAAEGVGRVALEAQEINAGVEVLTAPAGLDILIHDDKVKTEVTTEVTFFRESLQPNSEALDGNEAQTIPQKLDALNDLATLYVNEADFTLMGQSLLAEGFTQEEASEQLRAIEATHVNKLAAILEYSPKGNDVFTHESPAMVAIAMNGAVKPRAKLWEQGTHSQFSGRNKTGAPIEQVVNDALKGGFKETHSMLAHTRISPYDEARDKFWGGTVYLSAGSVIDQAPVMMRGGDAINTTNTVIRGGDEAHTNQGTTKQEFCAVEVAVSDEFMDRLPQVSPWEGENDVTFMARNPTAETAGDYEFGVEGGVLITSRASRQELEAKLKDKIEGSAVSETVWWKTYIAEENSSRKISKSIVGVAAKIANGEPLESFITNSESIPLWNEVVTAFSDFKSSLDQEATPEGYQKEAIDKYASELAVTRFLAERAGLPAERIESIFEQPETGSDVVDEVLNTAIGRVLSSKNKLPENTRFIQYKKFELGFDQKDLSQAAVKKLAAHHNIPT
jgi:hypothetical protein